MQIYQKKLIKNNANIHQCMNILANVDNIKRHLTVKKYSILNHKMILFAYLLW